MTEAKDLKAGDYIKLNNEIVKVIRKEVVAYGTHCHSKNKLFLQGLISKGQKIVNMSHSDKVETVEVIRKEGQVISKMPDKVQIMDNVSYETIDAEVDDELLNVLNEGDTVTFIEMEGKSKVMEKR